MAAAHTPFGIPLKGPKTQSVHFFIAQMPPPEVDRTKRQQACARN
ncbi:MAG: hypothetical protein R3E44_16380 [Paracoccaceae bacterium]